MDFEKLILENIDNPTELERLFRQDPDQFKICFDKVFSANPESIILQVWNERLHFAPFEKKDFKKRNELRDIFLVILLSLLAGTVAKLPGFFGTIQEDFFYPRNIAFTFLPMISFYFIIKNKVSKKIILSVVTLFLISLIYINILPDLKSSDTLILSCLHLPFFLWTLVGISFTGDDFRDSSEWMEYLKYNGELLIYIAILLVTGLILTGLTIALFSVIKIDIKNFYLNWIAIYGLAASPIVATYLTRVRSQIARNLAPSIAKIFSPLVLITLIIYLLTIIILRKSPFADRDFLFIFNVMLISVLAIVIFTIAERKAINSKTLSDYMNFLLVLLALIIDLVALSAILFRLTSYGMTPNRIAVLGINILIFINLAGVIINYIRFFKKKSTITSIEMWITKYLPVYSIWVAFVAFGFPFIFSFK
ncbi:MAG TPA: DUF4153 domain-containing protein [Caldisericia bacterium]|nr:DUF4153 domain-containing protein [Caldisericia bacterium]HPB34068.1 DUF4153 domain-containing protein [Caldisericia bacterium]HQL66184.1 DUF4153 domain-containing protein [Caldisericia bacterium]